MIVVSDTSAINNLAAINHLHLLQQLYGTVLIPEAVYLDLGEAEAIALAVETQADRVLIDERQGRLVAARLNLRYTGILGVLVEAKSQGLITEVKPLLDALINQAGFWVAKPLYNRVLRFVDEIR